ncbi:MAG: ABC transporter substrate-binding protein [Anaerolineae bacterium]
MKHRSLLSLATLAIALAVAVAGIAGCQAPQAPVASMPTQEAAPIPTLQPSAPTEAPKPAEPTPPPPPAPTPTAVSKPTPTQAPVPQTLVIGLGRDLYYGPKEWYMLHGSLAVWEPLVLPDHDLRASPVLAVSWEADETGTVWTLKLRQNVVFHDGTPFNADAVLLNVPKLQEEYSATLPGLDRLEKVDDYTVRFVLKQPVPDLPQRIAYFSSAMIAPSAIGVDGRPTAPIGTGPFRFVEYLKGDQIILERNEHYWGRPPKLERVIFKYIPDATTRLAALQTGEIDAIADVGSLQPEQASLVQADPNLVLLQQPVATTHYLVFHSGKPPFDDMRLRQAVSKALDRQGLVDQTVSGYGIPGISVITPLAKDWVRSDVAPQYDPEQAKALAREALGARRVPVRLVLNSAFLGRWPYANIAQILQAAVADLGMDVEIVTLESGAWNEALKNGDYNLTLTPYTLMTGEPDFFMSSWAWSKGDLNQRRSYGYANSRVDALVEAARREMDHTARKAMYDELQAILAEEVPFTPLYHEVTLYATRRNVADLFLDVQFKPGLDRAYKTAP